MMFSLLSEKFCTVGVQIMLRLPECRVVDYKIIYIKTVLQK